MDDRTNLRYNIKRIVTVSDIFKRFNIKKKCGFVPRQRKRFKEQMRAGFNYLLNCIIDDIIENNTTFVFPTVGKTDVHFCLIVDEGEIAKEKFQNGIYKNLDPLKTNFKGCYFGVVYRVGSKVKKYPIYIGKERIKRLYDNINNGKIVI